MEIIKIIAMAVTGVVLASLMKSVNKEMSIYIIIATVILIFLSVRHRQFLLLLTVCFPMTKLETA